MDLPHERHTEQNPKWLVGVRVRITKMPEHALRDVPKHRLTATGTISKVYIEFARTPNMRRVVYVVDYDTELLSTMSGGIKPGLDDFKLELL